MSINRSMFGVRFYTKSLPFGKVRVNVYDFHDAPTSAERVLFGWRVTVVAGCVAEFCHLGGRGEHE